MHLGHPEALRAVDGRGGDEVGDGAGALVAELVLPEVDGADRRHVRLAQLDEHVAEGARAGVATGVALRLDVEVGQAAFDSAVGCNVLDSLRTEPAKRV